MSPLRLHLTAHDPVLSDLDIPVYTVKGRRATWHMSQPEIATVAPYPLPGSMSHQERGVEVEIQNHALQPAPSPSTLCWQQECSAL